MPLNSINTNVGAMIALQNLNAINSELLVVQNRISTGKKIASAKDNPAVWAIAQGQRAESRALEAVQSSLQRGQAVVDVALSAGESIYDMMSSMKELLVRASEPGLVASERTALNNEYLSYRRQIDSMAGNAQFNGISLISAGSSGTIKALANAKGTSTVDVGHFDLTTTGAALAGMPADLTGTITSTEIAAMNTALGNVTDALAQIGSGGKALDTTLAFTAKLQDTIDAGIGRLVDADMAREAARLQALQVRQQLAIMALGIANRAPSLLLQLFQR